MFLFMPMFGSNETLGLHNPLVMVLICLSLGIPVFPCSQYSVCAPLLSPVAGSA